MSLTETGVKDMKEFLRLDVVIQNVAKKLKGKYKISRLIKTVSFAWFVFTLIATVWSLIPKTEEIPEVDAEAFLKTQSKKPKRN